MIKSAILTVGISASGKSTWARKFISDESSEGRLWIQTERDELRRKFLAEKSMGQIQELVWSKWDWKNENIISNRQWKEINDAYNDDLVSGIVISDTNLNTPRREKMIRKLEGIGFEVSERWFEISFKEAMRRDAERENGVGVSVLARQWDQWTELNVRNEPRYTPDTDLPPVYLCDLDGTLAHNTSGRSAFDWNRVGEDTLDTSVSMILNRLQDREYISVILLSGRDSCCYGETVIWLEKNGVEYNGLLMRAEGDMRPDEIVKKEIFWRDVAPKYNVLGVFDDRPKICRMWREIGVKTFQVGNPLIEF